MILFIWSTDVWVAFLGRTKFVTKMHRPNFISTAYVPGCLWARRPTNVWKLLWARENDGRQREWWQTECLVKCVVWVSVMLTIYCVVWRCLHNILPTAAWSQIYFVQPGHVSCFGDKLVTVIYAGTGTGFCSGPFSVARLLYIMNCTGIKPDCFA